MKNKILLISILLVVLIGCLETENSEIKEQEVALTDQNSLQKNLDILTIGVLGASENEIVKQIVYSEVEKQFDGEYNVLIKTLINEGHF